MRNGRYIGTAVLSRLFAEVKDMADLADQFLSSNKFTKKNSITSLRVHYLCFGK